MLYRIILNFDGIIYFRTNQFFSMIIIYIRKKVILDKLQKCRIVLGIVWIIPLSSFKIGATELLTSVPSSISDAFPRTSSRI